MDETPKIAEGSGKYTYKRPAHNKPTVRPKRALKGILVRGFSTKPKPVIINKARTSKLPADSNKPMTPVTKSNAPTTSPR